MFKQKSTNPLKKYGMHLGEYSIPELQNHNFANIIEAAQLYDTYEQQGRVFWHGRVSTKQNWVIIRQNEELLRHSRHLTAQYEEIIKQNNQILYHLQKDSSE